MIRLYVSWNYPDKVDKPTFFLKLKEKEILKITYV